MLTTCTGGTEHLHFVVFCTNLHILAVILDVRNDLDGRKGCLAASIGIKGRNTHQTVNTILTLQETIGIVAFNHNICRLQAGFVAFLVVHDLIGEAVRFCPTGVHTVEHLTPVLCLCTAGTCLEGHQGIILIIITGEQSLQTATFHILRQSLEAFLQLIQHGIIVFLRSHFTNGDHILPRGHHGSIAV